MNKNKKFDLTAVHDLPGSMTLVYSKKHMFVAFFVPSEGEANFFSEAENKNVNYPFQNSTLSSMTCGRTRDSGIPMYPRVVAASCAATIAEVYYRTTNIDASTIVRKRICRNDPFTWFEKTCCSIQWARPRTYTGWCKEKERKKKKERDR